MEDRLNGGMGSMIYGITMGDSSGVGPEILLKAYAAGEITEPFVGYGDASPLEFYSERLGYGIPIRRINAPGEMEAGSFNVIDHRLMQREHVTPGKLSRQSGHAAREY